MFICALFVCVVSKLHVIMCLFLYATSMFICVGKVHHMCVCVLCFIYVHHLRVSFMLMYVTYVCGLGMFILCVGCACQLCVHVWCVTYVSCGLV